MKKKILIAVTGSLAVAAFAFSGISSQAASLAELRSSAVVFCTPHTGTDCLSPATQNIYTNYELVSI